MQLLKHKANTGTDGHDHDQSNQKLRIMAIKYSYPLIILLMLILLAALAAFLYYNAYLAIGHAQNVAQLKKQILEEDLKNDDLAKILENLAQKNNDIQHNLEALNNPFERKWEIKK